MKNRKIISKKEIIDIENTLKSKSKKELKNETEKIKEEIKELQNGIKEILILFDEEDLFNIRKKNSDIGILDYLNELHKVFIKKFHANKYSSKKTKLGLIMGRIAYLKLLAAYKIVSEKIIDELRENNFEGLIIFLLNNRNKEINELIESVVID